MLRVPGDSLSYAFIGFDTDKASEEAYFKMNNVLIDDRRIKVAPLERLCMPACLHLCMYERCLSRTPRSYRALLPQTRIFFMYGHSVL